MKTVVLDTNVLVAAIRSRNGASFKLLSLVGTDSFELVVSVPLVFEYEYAMLKTAELCELDSSFVNDILDFVCASAKHQDIFFLWRPTLRDSSDDMVLEVAVASGADGIVTFNKRDFAKADRFDLKIYSPGEFLKSEGLL